MAETRAVRRSEHFFENYMEADRFPRATFTGRIIEKVDLSRDGEYIIRAKGRLKIHGVERERIIRSQVTTRGEKMHIVSEFTVGLREHNISVPKIVFQKIAREIKVRVEADLVR
ncbi:MAG TPA: YceI family protein [Bacteroidetes bacterium]|nr:YceI family protein [Bacteroidota bacterium]